MNQSHSSTSTVQHAIWLLLCLTQGAAETVTRYSKTRKQEAERPWAAVLRTPHTHRITLSCSWSHNKRTPPDWRLLSAHTSVHPLAARRSNLTYCHCALKHPHLTLAQRQHLQGLLMKRLEDANIIMNRSGCRLQHIVTKKKWIKTEVRQRSGQLWRD